VRSPWRQSVQTAHVGVVNIKSPYKDAPSITAITFVAKDCQSYCNSTSVLTDQELADGGPGSAICQPPGRRCNPLVEPLTFFEWTVCSSLYAVCAMCISWNYDIRCVFTWRRFLGRPYVVTGELIKCYWCFYTFSFFSPTVLRVPSTDCPETLPPDRNLRVFYNASPKIRGGALPQKKFGGQNMQNFGRFWTTSDFDREYLRKSWR